MARAIARTAPGDRSDGMAANRNVVLGRAPVSLRMGMTTIPSGVVLTVNPVVCKYYNLISSNISPLQ
jgi:hypothetical protein